MTATLNKRREIPWFRPQTGEREKHRVLSVLESNYLNDGSITRELEEKTAQLLGSRYCVAVTSGTAALALSLMALGIGPGDEVIVPDFTFIATANAVKLTGAHVRLVDIEPTRFTIDPNRAADAINSKTRALIAVDVNGRAADYRSLEPLCKERGIALVCDSAEAFGSQHCGRYLGTFGDLGCFSFSANKTISSGQGGLIVTNRESLFHRLKELKDQGRRNGGTGGDDLHPTLGFNFKYTNLHAAVALAQLERLSSRLEHFHSRDRWYRQALQECSHIVLPPLEEHSGEVRQWTDLLSDQRFAIEQSFKQNGIGYRPFWFPIHRQLPYSLPDDSFEHAIRASHQGLWLPSSFELIEEEAQFVSHVIWNTFHA